MKKDLIPAKIKSLQTESKKWQMIIPHSTREPKKKRLIPLLFKMQKRKTF